VTADLGAMFSSGVIDLVKIGRGINVRYVPQGAAWGGNHWGFFVKTILSQVHIGSNRRSCFEMRL